MSPTPRISPLSSFFLLHALVFLQPSRNQSWLPFTVDRAGVEIDTAARFSCPILVLSFNSSSFASLNRSTIRHRGLPSATDRDANDQLERCSLSIRASLTSGGHRSRGGRSLVAGLYCLQSKTSSGLLIRSHAPSCSARRYIPSEHVVANGRLNG